MAGQKPRQIAFRALRLRQRDPRFVETLLEAELAPARLNPLDRSLVRELVFGVVRWERTLDWLVARKTQGRPQPGTVRVLLNLGLYQLFWLDRVPDHAAVNESVGIARAFGQARQAGFINAVLRAYARERAETRELLDGLQRSDPALGFSHPTWLVNRWIDRYGRDTTVSLLDWNNTPAQTFARVNALRANTAELVESWRQEDVEIEEVSRDWLPPGMVFRLASPRPLAELASFRDGLFYVQDPSTLLAPRKLDPQSGETILDLCAAPGGKTLFAAQLMEDRGKIDAVDIAPERLDRLSENCARLGIKCVRPVLCGGDYRPAPHAYDRVLVDAPCSNSGVLRRRVDLRWRIRLDEIDRLRKVQIDLLRAAAVGVKPGGVIVYSTCSLEPEENDRVVDAFSQEHPDFRLEERLELMPVQHQTDGSFVARFRRET